MILRESCLPAGWYPRERAKIAQFLSSSVKTAQNSLSAGENASAALAAVAPHAGWYYSGQTAALALSSLDSEAETIAIIGGHLGGTMPVLFAEEDAAETPLGPIRIDGELREAFTGKIKCHPDIYDDNTVEVLIPMVRFFFPKASLLWLRFPANLSSFDSGKILAETASSLGRKLTVIASTDLTHYGRNYGFFPQGSGRSALEWVKNVNDAAFIGAVLDGDPARTLACAEGSKSACSAGAVLGALGFAAARGKRARLLDYRTSADAGGQGEGQDDYDVPDSFVGYAALSFNLDQND